MRTPADAKPTITELTAAAAAVRAVAGLATPPTDPDVADRLAAIIDCRSNDSS